MQVEGAVVVVATMMATVAAAVDITTMVAVVAIDKSRSPHPTVLAAVDGREQCFGVCMLSQDRHKA